MATPEIEVAATAEGGQQLILTGAWTLATLAPRIAAIERELAQHGTRAAWNCQGVEAMDSAGAMLLWRAWGRTLPALLLASPGQRRVLERIAEVAREPAPPAPSSAPVETVIAMGALALRVGRQLQDATALIGQLLLDLIHLGRHPNELPLREIFANLYKSGVRAMPVTALVGFLIGIVLSYLSALQLKQFGAGVFIVNILGLGIIRELGPVLVAVLVAGRSGSAMTAQLGVMRVTEEIDALAAMGVSRSLRLILPKVLALALVMPLLVLWATAMALLGGMMSAQIQLDISYGFFLDTLPKAVPVANLWIGLTKGSVFGILVALVACHFGLRVRPNTESLSANTTASVVTAITVVILVDAIFAIATRHMGLPF